MCGEEEQGRSSEKKEEDSTWGSVGHREGSGFSGALGTAHPMVCGQFFTRSKQTAQKDRNEPWAFLAHVRGLEEHSRYLKALGSGNLRHPEGGEAE